MPPAAFRLHRPLRAVAALTDVLAAIALGALAWWCWHQGVIVTVQDGVQVRRINGAWWAVATVGATLAGIALLDALRQLTLAASRFRL